MASPKLRFKEFDGDWNSIAIGKFLKIKSGLGFKAEEYSTEQEIRLLQIENVGYGAVKWTHNVKFVPTNYLDVHKDLVLKEGDLVLALNRPVTNDQLKIAKLTQEDSPSILYQRVGKLDFLKEDIDKEFIFQIFKKDVKNYVLNSSIGSDQPFISTTDLYKHKLCIPLKEEQTKIASFLSAVDEKINQLTQKHELLSQYKQGMMQKLFSQQLRFKADDGSEFGEWASEKISKVFTNKSKSFNPLLNESLPCIELEHLSQNTGQILGTVNSSDQQSTKNLFEPNSVLYGKLRPYLRKFAKPQFKGVCSSEIWVLTGLKISNDYLFQFVQSEQFTELTNIQSGSKMPRADWNVIADAEIEFPCLGEQTKIANFLSSIDQKIEVVAQQIEQAKQWKKGLLQQMFI